MKRITIFFLICCRFLHKIFHYNKLKLQQNNINIKRYTRLNIKGRLQSITNQKNKTTTKSKQTTTNTTRKSQTKTHKTKQNKTKGKKETHSIFSNDFSHVVYLFLHQNLLSTMHLRYLNYVIC